MLLVRHSTLLWTAVRPLPMLLKLVLKQLRK
jgi:hypothetical protein